MIVGSIVPFFIRPMAMRGRSYAATDYNRNGKGSLVNQLRDIVQAKAVAMGKAWINRFRVLTLKKTKGRWHARFRRRSLLPPCFSLPPIHRSRWTMITRDRSGEGGCHRNTSSLFCWQGVVPKQTNKQKKWKKKERRQYHSHIFFLLLPSIAWSGQLGLIIGHLGRRWHQSGSGILGRQW